MDPSRKRSLPTSANDDHHQSNEIKRIKYTATSSSSSLRHVILAQHQRNKQTRGSYDDEAEPTAEEQVEAEAEAEAVGAENLETDIASTKQKISALELRISTIEYLLKRKACNKAKNIQAPPGIEEELLLYEAYQECDLISEKNDLQKEKNTLLQEKILLLGKSV